MVIVVDSGPAGNPPKSLKMKPTARNYALFLLLTCTEFSLISE